MNDETNEGELFSAKNGGASNVVCLLKACANSKDLRSGSRLYAYIREHKFLERNPYVVSSLVNMYARCGELSTARQVLNNLSVGVVAAWNALMAGYIQQGQGEEALECFDSMQCNGCYPNAVTFTCALKACGSKGAVAKGEQIHHKIVCLHMLDKDIVLGNALIDMYVNCYALAKASHVLEGLPVRTVVSWTALISGHVRKGQAVDALKCFDNMQREGHFPDVVTFNCALKACGILGADVMGERIHEKILSLSMLDKSIVLGGTLIDMYVKCAALSKAQKALEELPIRNVVTWNALIAGYVQHGRGEEALKCFNSMESEGHIPDVVSFIYALKACASIGAAAKGEEIHDKIAGLGILEENIQLGNTLVDMYSKFGACAKAQQVLEGLPVRNEVTWNALIAGYAQEGLGEEALKCFDNIQDEGHLPNVVTFTYALKVCGCIGAAAKGEQIHDKVTSLGMLVKNIELGTALVDMYVRCAALAKAQLVLEDLPIQNVLTWTVLIAGYAQQGQIVEAFNCFTMMQSKGVKPNSTTFICMLNACSNLGLLDQAELLFSSMITRYCIAPIVQHYCCLVDLFGSAGKFKDALLAIKNMPFTECLPLWVALLGAGFKCGNLKIGKFAFKYALHSDKNDAAVYVCMANMHTTTVMQEDASWMEAMMVAAKAWKMPGYCLQPVAT